MNEFFRIIEEIKDFNSLLTDHLKTDKIKELLKQHFAFESGDSRFFQEQIANAITMIALVPKTQVPESIRFEDLVKSLQRVKALLGAVEEVLEA